MWLKKVCTYLRVEDPYANLIKFDYTLIGLLACVSFIVQSIAWPLSQGRDCGTYIMYYLDFLSVKPVFPMLMLHRTPGAPFFFGPALDHLGSGAVELVMGMCFVIASLAVYRIGLFWNRRVGLFSALALLLYTPYGALYHTVGSDSLFAFAFLLWVVFILYSANSPTWPNFLLTAFIFFILVLIRPVNQILLLFFLFPFLLTQISFSTRLRYSLIFLGTSVFFLSLWSTHNYIRYNDFTISRGGAAFFPFHRLFIHDRLVRPENGNYSEELERFVRAELLDKEPYLSYEITTETFFSAGDMRMCFDLLGLSDRIWGWDSDYKNLQRVGMEAIWHHPFKFIKNVTQSFLIGLTVNATHPTPLITQVEEHTSDPRPPNPKGLPTPTENSLIPGSHLWWMATTPDDSIYYDWIAFYNSQGTADTIRFKDPGMKIRYDQTKSRTSGLLSSLPNRNGVSIVSKILNAIGFVFPPMLIWILIGCASLIWRSTPRKYIMGFFLGLSLTIVFITALGVMGVYKYRLPLDPVFIVIGTNGALQLLRRPFTRVSSNKPG